MARRDFSLRHRDSGSADRTVSADPFLAVAPERDDGAPGAAELVPRAAAGDRSAWEALVDQYSRLIWAVTRDFRLPESDAADVVQSTWLRLLEHINRIEYPDRIASWLATTARHECLRHLAASRRVTLVEDDSAAFEASADQLPAVDERLLADEQAGAVRDAMSKLPSRSQQLLELLMADPPVSYLEISDQLGLPIGSIGPTRGRCLERLRLMLQTTSLVPNRRRAAGLRIRRVARLLSFCMGHSAKEASHPDARQIAGEASLPIVLASVLRENGNTGVHTHVQQLRDYLEENGITTTLVTPFSWGRPLTYPLFGLRRLVVDRCSRAAGVAWRLYWHELFLRKALRQLLADIGDCVIYAQGPAEAREALRVRRGPHQRVVMAVHFRLSRADEFADSREISRGGAVFRAIRKVDGQVIPHVDGLVYVSSWAREAVLSWLPEAAVVPSAVIGNCATALPSGPVLEPLGDLVTIGRLEHAKNHRFLLRVLAEANRAGRSFTLDVYGDGPLRTDLSQQIRSLELEEQVRLRGFRRGARDLLPRYRAYVHASYSESSSLAIIEAMAAGLPIVAANIGAIPELCDDGVEARFWPLDDPAQAAATLIRLLDSEQRRLKAASAASDRFRHDFDAAVVCPRLYSFLLQPAECPVALQGEDRQAVGPRVTAPIAFEGTLKRPAARINRPPHAIS